jgi:DNA polymerase III delta subunit
MITILCGQDFITSRAKLSEIRDNSEASEKIILSAKDLNLEVLTQELLSLTLFSDKKLLIVEDFFQQKNVSFKIFDDLSDKIDLVLWESGDLPKSLRFGKDVTVLNFKPKQIIFKYIDSLIPQNKKVSLNLLFETYEENVDEPAIFYFLIKHIRFLIVSKLKNPKVFFKTENQADWLVDKYFFLSQKFDFKKLKRIYELLCETELRLKTGKLDSLKQPLFWATYQLTA